MKTFSVTIHKKTTIESSGLTFQNVNGHAQITQIFPWSPFAKQAPELEEGMRIKYVNEDRCNHAAHANRLILQADKTVTLLVEDPTGKEESDTSDDNSHVETGEQEMVYAYCCWWR